MLIIPHLQSNGSDNDILSEIDDSIILFVANNSLVLTSEAEQQPCTNKDNESVFQDVLQVAIR